MVLNTLTVGAAVTPAVIQTYISHYANRKPLRQKPTAHISYHEGLALIRQFLYYASHHTVEELQAFTSQWVPHPRWVKVDRVTISQEILSKAADALIAQLGEEGIKKVGGQLWWQWRRQNQDLEAEWIEMRNDYNARTKKLIDGRRVMLYVHGGAYFFGSVDEHRYQMQRHARKLRARVFAPRYRLAPQFPFPCGLQDCLAAYLYLLTVQDPTDIILAGDSAGGGMVVSMLVTLRDQGLPLPAGAILISPWVDLTHSFPSLADSGGLDYIPAHGFMQRPSAAWPPPNDQETESIRKGASISSSWSHKERKAEENSAIKGFSAQPTPQTTALTEVAENGKRGIREDGIPGFGSKLSIEIDGTTVVLKDQIQMYATNELISHPLVSPVLQPSLGGLPPLLILTGGGELLRDEQIYLAHKAANPSKYLPGDAYLDAYDPGRTIVSKYKPTDVQLQVWDDLCHVAPTLSFTGPAKYMYRSVAQFGAWVLARAQKSAIEIVDDDEVSVISSGSSTSASTENLSAMKQSEPVVSIPLGKAEVGKAGDPLPRFQNHMIRQQVDRHGAIRDLTPESALPALQMPSSAVGVIKPGPVQKWMKAKEHWDGKYASEKRRVQKQRMREMKDGFERFGDGEVPPPSALAGRRKRGDTDKMKRRRKGFGLMLWSLWGSSHDEDTIHREEKLQSMNGEAADTTTTTADAEGTETTTTNRDRAASGSARLMPRPRAQSRSRSRRRTVTDAGQTDPSELELPGMANLMTSSDGPVPVSATSNNQPAASLQPFASPMPDTSSILSTSMAAPDTSDTASVTAVFAAPGVLKAPEHSRKGTLSSLGPDIPGIFVTDDERDSNAPETSRRGSLQSVDRLRSHQIQLSDGDGEVASATMPNGASETTDLLSKRPVPTERSISSTAVRRVEGVMKDHGNEWDNEANSGPGEKNVIEPVAEVVVNGTQNPTDNETHGAGVLAEEDRRPNMPERDAFVTAREL